MPDDYLLRACDALDDIYIHYYIELTVKNLEKRHFLVSKQQETPDKKTPIETSYREPDEFARVDGVSINGYNFEDDDFVN